MNVLYMDGKRPFHLCSIFNNLKKTKIDFEQFSIQFLIFQITKKKKRKLIFWQFWIQFSIFSNFKQFSSIFSNFELTFQFFWNMWKIENWFLTIFNQVLMKFFMRIQFFWKMKKWQIDKKLSRSQGPKQMFLRETQK